MMCDRYDKCTKTDCGMCDEMLTTDNTLYNVNDYNDGIVDPTYIDGIIDCSDLGIFPWGDS